MSKASLVVLFVMTAACASARRGGPSVAVYEADASAAPDARRLPDGCRSLATSGPVDQMESERAMDDPYRRQRRDTAERGGNVLLVLSQRTVTRPNLDCPAGDTSPSCLGASKSWYRISFQEYACSPEAIQRLAGSKPGTHRGGITISLSSLKLKEAGSALAPGDLKEKLLEMMHAGVKPEVLLAYVRGQRVTRKMTAEEIIDWTKSGIPDAVIETAASLTPSS